INGVLYAFIGLERVGGVMVYDLTDPTAPEYVTYLSSTRINLSPRAAGDISPEGFDFVSAENSPTGNALLIIGHEVSGTVTVWEFQ
ncbi:MAG: alkaline phosphatase, partial [Chloroflexi bacterium]|nr:alkaline phosphatase [Chloroflexota bacterium]